MTQKDVTKVNICKRVFSGLAFGGDPSQITIEDGIQPNHTIAKIKNKPIMMLAWNERDNQYVTCLDAEIYDGSGFLDFFNVFKNQTNKTDGRGEELIELQGGGGANNGRRRRRNYPKDKKYRFKEDSTLLRQVISDIFDVEFNGKVTAFPFDKIRC